jgi:hypothetical protein
MSSYHVISQVSERLQAILWSEFSKDLTIRNIVMSEQAIVFTNPTETARDSANKLSLWLYHITENEFLKNQPMQRVVRPAGPASLPRYDQVQFPPLALNLFYLVTPFAASGTSDHLLLGKTMQVMYDSAILPLRNTAAQISEELRIVLCRTTIQELSSIWEALREPYRLSVCYEVRVTRINSERMEETAPVIERRNGYLITRGSNASEELEPELEP